MFTKKDPFLVKIGDGENWMLCGLPKMNPFTQKNESGDGSKTLLYGANWRCTPSSAALNAALFSSIGFQHISNRIPAFIHNIYPML